MMIMEILTDYGGIYYWREIVPINHVYIVLVSNITQTKQFHRRRNHRLPIIGIL